ncbi:MAG: hypothetical protein ACI86P_002222 [Flavobacteriales bacterium]|jgi:hypothetical protein
MRIKGTLLLLSLICSSFVFGQKTGTVRGFLYDEKNGEPVIFTTVGLQGTTLGASSDVNGFYQISQVPPGKYVLSVTAMNYDSLASPIMLSGGQVLNQNLFLKAATTQLGVVNINATKKVATTQVRMSVEKVTPKQIKALPSIGGDADLAQYLQVLPGVVFTGDQGGQLYIRGGTPIQNKVLLDGMIVYNPFHSIGLFSVFDTDILRNADVYTGGFGAEYGGRISSIMDITTKDGNKTRFGGKLSANTFGSKLLLEGPIKKQVRGSGSSSFVFSGKTSYLDESSKVFYENVNDGEGLPFKFTDLYGKISINGATGSKVNFFGYNFSDQVNYSVLQDLRWDSYGVGTNFVLIPGKTPTLISGNAAFSNYKIQLDEQNLDPRTSEIGGFNFGLDFKYFLGDDEIKYGLEMLGFQTKFNFFNSLGVQLDQTENTTEIGGYISSKIKANRLVIEPSLRGHFYASLNNFSLEPRLGAKFNVTENLRLKGAAGIYSQNLISASSDRDVVNLFYGFLSGSDNLQDTFLEQDGEVRELKHKLQKAIHYIVGTEVDITDKINLNVEGYIKDFTQLSNTNRNRLFDDNSQNADVADVFKKEFIVETGIAKGVDFVIKYDNGRRNVWLVYSLADSDRWDGVQEYDPVFDRRHNVNFVASQILGEKKDWEVSIRWNLGSGLPFTQTQGFYQELLFTEGADSEFWTENPTEVGVELAGLNQGRLSDYGRVDANVKKFFRFSDTNIVEVNLSVTNLTDRENIFFVDRLVNEKVYQLPLLPALGISWTF